MTLRKSIQSKLLHDAQPIIKLALKAYIPRNWLIVYIVHKNYVLEENEIAKRQTAAEYLKKIEKTGLLRSIKLGKEVYYINQGLMQVLSQ